MTRKQILKWFDDINSSEVTLDRLEYVIEKIMGIVGHTTIPVATHRLYRCRPFKDSGIQKDSLSDLLQPPAEFTKDGRCNIEGRPVLYVSDNANALVEECNLEIGQKFCLLQFDRLSNLTEDLNCMMLGIEPNHALSNDPSIREIKQFWQDFYGKEYSKYQEISSCLHKVFVRNGTDNSIVYKLTSKLCHSYFEKNSKLDAIFYPSIANKGAWRNYAIRPSVINKAYTPSKVVFCELAEDRSFIWLDGGEIENNGDISWGREMFLDFPVAVGMSPLDVSDPELYIHPLKG